MTINEIKALCQGVVSHHEKFRNDVDEPRIAKALLLTIGYIEEDLAYPPLNLRAREKLSEICKLFP
jgi:hypothetical protein